MKYKIEKVYADDFESIYPLFRLFNNPKLTKEDWRQLFIKHWDQEEDYFGFKMIDEENGAVFGFIGFIFSRREFDGKIHKMNNMTTWVIDTPYQRKGLARKLMAEVLKMEGYTFTNFTAAAETIEMIRQFDFTMMDASVAIIRPRPSLKSIGSVFYNRFAVITKPKKVKKYLEGNDLTYFNDHARVRCERIIIREKKTGETCFLMLTKTSRGIYPYLKIQYLSNMDLFVRSIHTINPRLCLRYGILGVIIDNRLVENVDIGHKVVRPLTTMLAFKSDTLTEAHITDTLYSEFFLLNL